MANEMMMMMMMMMMVTVIIILIETIISPVQIVLSNF